MNMHTLHAHLPECGELRFAESCCRSTKKYLKGA